MMNAPDKLGLAVLISGGGSNLQAIINACEAPGFPAKIEIVIANTQDASGIERAKKANIPYSIVPNKNFSSRALFEDALQNELAKHPIDLICLAGFMRILTPDFIEKWPQRIINTHPSLLPDFGGEGMYGERVHSAVIKSGHKQSGSTIHYVIPDVDKGEIILQKRVPVFENDTPETLGLRVLEQEHIAYPEAIRKIAGAMLKSEKS